MKGRVDPHIPPIHAEEWARTVMRAWILSVTFSSDFRYAYYLAAKELEWFKEDNMLVEFFTHADHDPLNKQGSRQSVCCRTPPGLGDNETFAHVPSPGSGGSIAMYSWSTSPGSGSSTNTSAQIIAARARAREIEQATQREARNASSGVSRTPRREADDMTPNPMRSNLSRLGETAEDHWKRGAQT